MQTLAKSPRSFTYGDYRHWPEEERWELIDGAAYDMCPAPGRNHQDFVVELSYQIKDFLKGKPCKVYVAPLDVRLPDRNEADDEVKTVVQPDISVICDRSKLDQAGCRGAPDWIIEILFPAPSHKDQTVKKALYERHGVREYWLVDPESRLLTRYFLEEGRYLPPLVEPADGITPVRVLPGLEIDWSFLATEF